MTEYTTNHFKKLKGLEPVQKRPGMYTSTQSPLHLVIELLDNALDESAASTQKPITVSVETKTGRITVSDNGRGIPFDIHPEYGMSGVRLAFEELHAGAKFHEDGDSAYKTTGGLHGVGCAVVNALAANLAVSSNRDGKTYTVLYENGVLKDESSIDATSLSGTSVSFIPDSKYFNHSINWEEFEVILGQKAAVSGITINYEIDENKKTFKEDISTYFHKLLTVYPKDKYIVIPFSGTGGNKRDKILVEGYAAIGWTNLNGGQSFYNNIFTSGGGDHFNGIIEGAREGVISHLGTDIRADKIISSDIQVFVLVSVKIPGIYQAKLSGQQKDSVDCPDVYTIAKQSIIAAIPGALIDNRGARKKIIEFITARINRREKLREEETKVKKKTSSLPKKLIAPRNWGEDTELFLVEGDSAAKAKAITSSYQGILPMKGMVINAYSNTDKDDALEWVLENAYRLGKIIFLADADPAGSAITVYGCAYIFKYAPDLYLQGKIYAVRPPLFAIKQGRETVYADSIENAPKGSRITRFKGLGEMNPEQVKDTCTNPQNRRIEQLTITDMEKTKEVFRLLLGKDSSGRKEWLGTYR